MNLTITPARLSGTVTPPPSKSQDHRLLLCAALAGGHAPQEAEQSRQTQNFFEKAGQPLAKIGEP